MSLEQEMKVLKRNGKYENVGFDKILKRVKSIGTECGIKLNYTTFVMKVIDQLYDGIPTTKIDELTAEQCAALSVQHPDYNTLAGRIVISNHHKNTSGSFFSVMKKLYEFTDIHNKQHSLVSNDFFLIVEKYKDEFDNMIVHERDYLIDSPFYNNVVIIDEVHNFVSQISNNDYLITCQTDSHGTRNCFHGHTLVQ